MGSLFGKSKKHESRVTDHDRAILQLKQQRDTLRQYQKKINAQLEIERKAAKKLLAEGKKEKAKLLLRKKKYQEGLIEKTDNQLENIEKLVQDIEFSQIENKVVEGLKVGNDSLKKMHQMMSLEDVEKIIDETQEGIEYQREIDEMLAGSLTQQDEDDVLAELDQIVQETLPSVPGPGERGQDISNQLQLPDVPTDDLEKEEKKKANMSRTEERTALTA